MEKTYLDCSDKKWLKRAERTEPWFGSGTFDLRFPEIQNTMIDSTFKTVGGLVSWKLRYQNLGIPTPADDIQALLPMQKPDFKCGKGELKYTWLGHSTAVISTQTFNCLIDPVFSQRCSPVSFAGPQRFRPAACGIEDLPRIDIVMISHDHYDHWDYSALTAIEAKFHPWFVSGLGSEDVLPTGCRFKTMDWTQFWDIEVRGEKVRITFLPVCHWGRRGASDWCKRLWGGFAVQLPSNHKFFYSGDTGYCEVFKQIGQTFKQFDLAILPIGAYQPREYLKPQHVNPEEAVQVHKELGSKLSVGVHWGTFPLGYQHFMAPRKDLKEALEKHDLPSDCFQAPGHGESVSVRLK